MKKKDRSNRIIKNEDRSLKENFSSVFNFILISVFALCTFFLILFSSKGFLFLEALGIIFAYLTLFLIFILFLIRFILVVLIKNNSFRFVVYLFSVVLGVFFTLIIITGVWIRFDVKTQCQDSKMEYEGDCIDALTSLLKDERKGFRSRNSAIWALGQLGDNRAFPVLQSFYTGNIPLREPLDKSISQYELKKAINLTSGGSNPFALFWRHGINL